MAGSFRCLEWEAKHVFVMPRHRIETGVFGGVERQAIAPRIVNGGQDPEIALGIPHDPLPSQPLHEDGPGALRRHHRVLSLVTTGFVHHVPHRPSIAPSTKRPGFEHDGVPGKHFRRRPRRPRVTRLSIRRDNRGGPRRALWAFSRMASLRARAYHLATVKPRAFARTLMWLTLATLVVSLLASAAPRVLAAGAPDAATAPVVVDGVTLFRVRGLSAYPADERAGAIAERIRAAAADSSVAIATLRIVPDERSNDIMIGDSPIMSVLEADAEVEGIHREGLARAYVHRIRGAVEAYRRDRSPRTLLVGAGMSLAATAALAGAVFLLIRLWRRLNAILERRYAHRLRSLEIQSVQVIHAERLREAVRTALRVARTLVVLTLAYLYLHFVLTRFPWTRPIASQLLGYVIAPLTIMGGALVTHVPNLVFLVILIAVTRYLLKVVALVFTGIERGTITFAGFDQEWAVPTYRIVRIAVIGFAAVVAYP